MSKLHVAVLRGGPSLSYDLSLKSGSHVLQKLPEKYQGHDIFISRDGIWHRDGLPRSPDRALGNIDVVVNALHGKYGEDGKVQKILDSLEIPYTGSGAIASSIAMNKVLSKKAFEQNKIKTPYYKIVKNTDDMRYIGRFAFTNFFLPFIVKPATGGSSLGVTVVKDFRYLEHALTKAFQYSDTALMEEYVRGKEATCVVIDDFRGVKTYSLFPIEIKYPREHEYFITQEKINAHSEHVIPGNFTAEEKFELQHIARTMHEALNLKGYSQTDFIVTPRRGIYILEVNTHPLLTPSSLLHQSLNAVGTQYSDFLDHIILHASL